MERIAGRIAFVTGGASGIGLGIVEALIADGAQVVLADRDATSLARECARLGSSALACQLDVTDRSAWRTAKALTEESFGPVDILVNNAGVAPDWNELVDTPEEHFDRLIDIMVTGMFNGIRTFGAAMRDRAEGHIVNTSSMNGLVPWPRTGAYTTAKFAVVGLSEVLHREMAPHGVGVSVLCPGSVRSNLVPSGRPEHSRATDRVLDPGVVGMQVLDAIRKSELYVMTHGEHKRIVVERMAPLLDAFDRAVARDSVD